MSKIREELHKFNTKEIKLSVNKWVNIKWAVVNNDFNNS